MAASSSSSQTAAERDPESQIRPKTKVSHFRHLIDQAGVTQEVLDHRYEGQGTVESPYLVEFLREDPWNPMTFSRSFKWLVTVLQAVATLAVTFASSAYTGGFVEIMEAFGVVEELAILGVSMFVVGFAVGPLLWAPLSEMFGRQRLFIVTYSLLTIFNAAACGSPNIGALIVFRFLAGSVGSSPLTNAGGVIADLFSANERGIATSIFAMAPFLGPALGEKCFSSSQSTRAC